MKREAVLGLFASPGPDQKRLRSALSLSERAARQVIRAVAPEIDAGVEDAIIHAARMDEMAEALERQVKEHLEQEECDEFMAAEAVLNALSSLKLTEVPCPMCDNGDLKPDSAVKGRFACDTCDLVIIDALCMSTQAVRQRLGDALTAHSARQCKVLRPALSSNGKGGMRVECTVCGDSNVVFSGSV